MSNSFTENCRNCSSVDPDQYLDKAVPLRFPFETHHFDNLDLPPATESLTNSSLPTSPHPNNISHLEITDLEPDSLIPKEKVDTKSSSKAKVTSLVETIGHELKLETKENDELGPEKEENRLAIIPVQPESLVEYVRRIGVPKICKLIKEMIGIAVKKKFKDNESKSMPILPNPELLAIGPPLRRRNKTTITGKFKFSFMLSKEYNIFAANIDKLQVEQGTGEQARNRRPPSTFSFLERLQGWEIEQRLRINGKFDEYYYHHNNVQFRSIVEVNKFILYNVYPGSLARRKSEKESMAQDCGQRRSRKRGPYKKRRTSPGVATAFKQKQKQKQTWEEEPIMAIPLNSFRLPDENWAGTYSKAVQSDEDLPNKLKRSKENHLPIEPNAGNKEGRSNLDGNSVEVSHPIQTQVPPSNHQVPGIVVQTVPVAMDSNKENPSPLEVINAGNKECGSNLVANHYAEVAPTIEAQESIPAPLDKAPTIPVKINQVNMDTCLGNPATDVLPATNPADSEEEIFGDLDNIIEPEDLMAASVLNNHFKIELRQDNYPF